MARATSRRAAAYIALVCALGAGGVGLTRFRAPASDQHLPVAAAKRGEFLVIVRCRGDITAARSIQIYAPIVPNLTIAWMTPDGERVTEGRPIVRFDSSSIQQQLVQKEAALQQAQATLEQAAVQARITAEHDQTDLRQAAYDVETARLKTADNDFVARLQAEQARLDVGIAEQKRRVQEAAVALHAASDRSKIASLTRQRDQAQADVDLTRRRIAQMEIRAPLTGYVVFMSNYSQGPIDGKPFKVGDTVFAGMNLAVMPDMASLQMDATIEESDRGRIEPGRDVRVRVDALPELSIAATVTSISPLAEAGVEWPPTRSFRAYAALHAPDPRLRPGMNGGMDIVVKRIPDAISIPSRAVFNHEGRPVVYIADAGGYRRAPVQLLARNPEEVAVSGIPADARVTLAEPRSDDAGR